MDDLISRQAAIDAVKAYWKKVVDDIPKGVGFEELTQLCNMALEHNANILKAIDQLPSAQPEQRWIPCSERLPEESGRYLVSREVQIDAITMTECVMEQEPSEDVKPVVHAHWIRTAIDDGNKGYIRCSNCGADFSLPVHKMQGFYQRYCGSCGAQMDEEDNK